VRSWLLHLRQGQPPTQPATNPHPQEYGQLAEAVKFIEDRATGRSRGVAVVEFAAPEEAAAAKAGLAGCARLVGGLQGGTGALSCLVAVEPFVAHRTNPTLTESTFCRREFAEGQACAPAWVAPGLFAGWQPRPPPGGPPPPAAPPGGAPGGIPMLGGSVSGYPPGAMVLAQAPPGAPQNGVPAGGFGGPGFGGGGGRGGGGGMQQQGRGGGQFGGGGGGGVRMGGQGGRGGPQGMMGGRGMPQGMVVLNPQMAAMMMGGAVPIMGAPMMMAPGGGGMGGGGRQDGGPPDMKRARQG
jgi:hypothetical protein